MFKCMNTKLPQDAENPQISVCVCTYVCPGIRNTSNSELTGQETLPKLNYSMLLLVKEKGYWHLEEKKRKKLKKYPCQSHLWISCSSMSFTLLLGNSSSRLTLRNLSFQPQDSNEIFITRFILRSVYSEILKIFRSYTFAMSLGVLFQTEGNTFLRLKQCLAHER